MSTSPPPSSQQQPPGDDADLLASLYLDGEATAEERAQVDADPQLLALVEVFRSSADAIADVTPPPGLAARHIGAALDLFDDQHQTSVSEAATVSSLSERRSRRSGIPTWLGAAAVAALVIGGLGFATTLSGDDDDEAASQETSVSESATNRDADTAAAADDAEFATEALEAESAGDDSMAEESMADGAAEEAMEEDSGEEAMEEEESADEAPASEDPATFYAERGPINLEDFEPGTAPQYFEQLADQFPLRPISDAPCAGSPLLEGLFGVDSFYPIIFAGQPASLIVQEGAPATALIVGPTCEIELQ